MTVSVDTASGFSIRRSVLDCLKDGSEPWATVSLPVERAWNRARENQTRMRSLLGRVRTRLSNWTEREGRENVDIDALLEPIAGRVQDPDLWGNGADGLVAFLGPQTSLVRGLPFPASELAVVDRRPHVRTLWRHLEPDGRFYVLALSLGGIRLYRASRYAIEAVDLSDTPLSLDEAMAYDERTRSLRFHTGAPPASGGRRAAIFHGHEGAGDDAVGKKEALRFMQSLDNGVRDVLDEETTPAPLVLAGTDALRGLYRKANKYPHLVDEGVEGDLTNGGEAGEEGEPAWNDEVLREHGWAAVRPHFDASRREAVDAFRSNPEQTAANEGSALLAAAEGRVDTLFVPEHLQVWGTFDEAEHAVSIHRERQAGDTELLNAASALTLQSGGTVYVVGGQGALPEDVRIAALLRY